MDVAESGKHLLQISTTAVWNKLYRMDLIPGNEIRFQEIDLTIWYSMHSHLFMQHELAVVMWYRFSSESGLQSTTWRSPYDPLRALVRLKNELIARGLIMTTSILSSGM